MEHNQETPILLIKQFNDFCHPSTYNKSKSPFNNQIIQLIQQTIWHREHDSFNSTNHTSKTLFNFSLSETNQMELNFTITPMKLKEQKKKSQDKRNAFNYGKTCLTDSAISGPIPSPGKRVARIRLEESDEEKDRLKDEKNLDELGLPSKSLKFWEPIFCQLNADSRLRVLG